MHLLNRLVTNSLQSIQLLVLKRLYKMEHWHLLVFGIIYMMPIPLYLKRQFMVPNYTVAMMVELAGKKHMIKPLVYIVPTVIILVKYL